MPDPRRRGAKSERILLKGDVPSPISPPSGCRFHTRCWKATQVCKTTEPPLLQLKTGHQVACHHPENGEDQAPGDAPLVADVITVKSAAPAEPAVAESVAEEAPEPAAEPETPAEPEASEETAGPKASTEPEAAAEPETPAEPEASEEASEPAAEADDKGASATPTGAEDKTKE